MGTDLSFDEANYLLANPDVAAAVNEGRIKSGYDHFIKYGEKEGRRLNKPDHELSREEKVFSLLNKQGLGLEIGPSHNPVAPKKNGYNVHILDHMCADDLRRKYKEHTTQGVNLDNIEEVDFVWNGEPYHELIGNTACYDWIIASHVIEHVPDLVSFLLQCEQLLKQDGLLSLVIPDKRFCFDYLSTSSSTGNVLDAYDDNRKRPSHGQIFDHFANAAIRNGNIAWSADENYGTGNLIHTFAQAQELWNQSVSSTEYIDAHCWRFTPASFRLIISDLVKLGICELMIQKEFDTAGCEFIVTLGRNSNPSKNLDRLDSLQLIKDNDVEDVHKALQQKDAHIERLSQSLQNKNVQLDNLGQKVDLLASELDAIKSSTSWRATAPLRWIMNRSLLFIK